MLGLMTHYTKEDGKILFAGGELYKDVHVTSASLIQVIAEYRDESIHQKV